MIRGLTNGDLEVVRNQVNLHVPEYSLRISDPLDALRHGIGHCGPKAAIAAGIVAITHGIEVDFAFNVKSQGTPMDGLVKPTRKSTHISEHARQKSHALMLAPLLEGKHEEVLCLEFNYPTHQQGHISRYSRNGASASIRRDGRITIAGAEKTAGIRAFPWREGVERYMRALGREFDADELIEELVARGIS